MLAHELFNDLGKPRKGANVVIKLDMAKVYDRTSWPFICIMLRKLGFVEEWIELIHRFNSKNSYYLIVNGSKHVFFKSERGLEHGYPFSHSHFILGAKLISRMLNNLYSSSRYKWYFMNGQGPKINHLYFVDDTIIFCTSIKYSLQLTLKTLIQYEKVFGQLINKSKSRFTMSPSTTQSTITRVCRILGMG